jgi:hypothetical protein
MALISMDTITLTLTVDQLNVILSGLGHVPYMHAQPLLVELQRQVTEQLPQAEVTAAPGSP